jgi:hypothetical protein
VQEQARGSSSHRGAYVGHDGKRYYVSGKTKEEARYTLREARAITDAGLVLDAGNLTVGKYLDHCLNPRVQRRQESTQDIIMAVLPARPSHLVRGATIARRG